MFYCTSIFSYILTKICKGFHEVWTYKKWIGCSTCVWCGVYTHCLVFTLISFNILCVPNFFFMHSLRKNLKGCVYIEFLYQTTEVNQSLPKLLHNWDIINGIILRTTTLKSSLQKLSVHNHDLVDRQGVPICTIRSYYFTVSWFSLSLGTWHNISNSAGATLEKQRTLTPPVHQCTRSMFHVYWSYGCLFMFCFYVVFLFVCCFMFFVACIYFPNLVFISGIFFRFPFGYWFLLLFILWNDDSFVCKLYI